MSNENDSIQNWQSDGSGVERLQAIMCALRNPETGCPWDVEQTFDSIAPYTLEEAYEVVDAIERNDIDDIKDELGDLLLQVVFHARIAEEGGLFDFNDVAQSIVEKMIRRHPHVFGTDGTGKDKTVFSSQQEMKQAWERIKREERELKGGDSDIGTSVLDGVPVGMSALVRASKIQKRAARVGFDWQTIPPVLEKVDEETAEVREAIEQGDSFSIEDEIGDLLFAVTNLARHCRVDPERALRGATTKFKKRFHVMEQDFIRQNKELSSLDEQQLDQAWENAKRLLNKNTA